MDLLFDQEKGIGCSILRTEIGCGESKPTIEPEPGVWDRSGDPENYGIFGRRFPAVLTRYMEPSGLPPSG